MEPLSEENEKSTPLQRLLIGGGTLIVVLLTVVAAVFLASQDLPDNQGTPVVNVSPTAVFVTNTPPVSTNPTATPIQTSTDTPTTLPAPTDTPQLPPPTDTPQLPPPTDTPQLPPPTDTPVAEQLPTATFTPVPQPPSPTPVPQNTAPPAQPTATQVVINNNCPPPANWVVYLVQTGDTLEVLARRTNVSVFDLQKANCLQSFALQPNQPLYLPFPPPTATIPNTPSPTRVDGPTPTRTPTPVAPRINEATVRISGDIVTVFVIGENFRSRDTGFRAQLVGPATIELTLGAARTVTNFDATAPASEMRPGFYNLVVINPDGFLDVKENVYPPIESAPTATPAPPEISRVSPSSGSAGSDITMTIQGQNFQPLTSGFEVELNKIDGTKNVNYNVDQSNRPATSTSFDIVITAGSLTVGTYDLLVTNPNGQTDIERFAYEAN